MVLSADCTKGFCSSNIVVIFDNFLIFNFPFFKFQTLVFYSFFLNKYFSIFNVLTQTLWVYHRLSVFRIAKMVYYNHRSLMISVNDARYIHLLPIFSTFQSSSYCKCKPFINSFQSYLFRYKCWLSYLSAMEQPIYCTIRISISSTKHV